jgi:hypothetical protein
METAGTQHLIERTYREGGTFQWVRETYVNAIEADATRIEFGIEWQAVENLGVYRRVIADNGRGMTAEELVAFFNTFGGGGKPIGGVHENFGVGFKTSTLPWNRYGIAVISWVDAEPAMILVQHDAATGEYGLRLEEIEDDETGETTLEEVYAPYDDPEHGCDWDAVKPPWIAEHGTVIVLLGNDPHEDVLGDPNRSEGDIKGVSAYLNRRLWEIQVGVAVTVDELRTQDRSQWPPSSEVAHGGQPTHGPDRRTNTRTIQGARHYIEYKSGAFKGGRLASSGKAQLSDGTEVLWYLWDGDRPAVQSYAAISGYIGALYQGELYDVSSHHATFRSFGISESAVRQKLWLILAPPILDDKGGQGVYPKTDRHSLALKGGPDAGAPLPFNDWGNEFANSMPDPILEAIKATRAGAAGTVSDPVWRDRLAERFGSRWRVPKLRTRSGGPLTVEPTQKGTRPIRKKAVHKRRSHGVGGVRVGGGGGGLVLGAQPGAHEAVQIKVGGGIPNYRAVRADVVSPGILAAWQPHDPIDPEGVVLLNVDHPVIMAQIEHWQAQYPDHYADDIANDVIAVYGEVAVAKVAHSEHLRGVLPSKTVDDDLRSEAALTMALLGLMAEEAVLGPRIGGKYSKKRPAA